MTHETAEDVGARLPENLKNVETTGESVAIESDGRTVAVLVSAEDFALLQRLRCGLPNRVEPRRGSASRQSAMRQPSRPA